MSEDRSFLSENSAAILQGVDLPNRHLDRGAPIPSEEHIVWEGRPLFLSYFIQLFWSAVFFILWLYFYQSLYKLIDIPYAESLLIEAGNKVNIGHHYLLQYIAYLLIFFMLINLSNIVITVLRNINTFYAITTQRIIIQQGILKIINYQIELFRLKDYLIEQTLWAKLCDFVNVHAITHSKTSPKIALLGLPNDPYVIEIMRKSAKVARSKITYVLKEGEV